MTEKKLGSEPAFPMVNSDGLPGLITEPYSDYLLNHYTNGMSKRLYIAINYSDSAYKWAEEMAISTCKEILGLGEKDNWIYTKHFPILVVKLQYILTDEFLRQEQL